MPYSLIPTLRFFHKWAAVVITVPVIIVILTGILLQVRKPIDIIQPNSTFGVAKYQPTANLAAILESVKSVPEMNVNGWEDIKVLDLRPKRGIVKVRNYDEFEVQVDAKSAEVLHTGQRLNDIVMQFHDGTRWNVRMEVFLPVALILLFMTVSGIFLLVQMTDAKLRNRKRKRIAAVEAPTRIVIGPPSHKPKRRFRLPAFSSKMHYYLGLIVAIPWIIVIVSGLLLQVRYEVPWVKPPLQTGSEGVPELQFTEVMRKAGLIPGVDLSDWEDVWRFYVYPNKGVVSVRSKSRWQTQFDLNTGELLDLSFRRTDLIEDIHEGKWMGANFWLFLPVHVVSLFLWFFGVVIWINSIFPRFLKRTVKANG